MIIVTGGAGFIGSAVVWGLNLRGIDDILIVDSLGTSGNWKNLPALRFADYIGKDRFRSMIESGAMHNDIQAIIHMGACSNTLERDASFLMENNFEFTKTLAIWAAKRNIRFIYASSAATYGDGSNGYDDDEKVIENVRPLNMYGYSKQLFDLWAKRQGLLGRSVGLKFSNVFGPNEYHKANMRSMVIQAFEQIAATGAVRLFKSYREEYADGEQQRDFLYVKDAVAMTLFFLDHPDANGIFNIGAGKARTWNDLVKAVFKALDKKVNIEYIDMPVELRKQYQYFTELPMDKIRSAGYARPTTSLEDAIVDYVRNYLVGNKHLDCLTPGNISLE